MSAIRVGWMPSIVPQKRNGRGGGLKSAVGPPQNPTHSTSLYERLCQNSSLFFSGAPADLVGQIGAHGDDEVGRSERLGRSAVDQVAPELRLGSAVEPVPQQP